MPAIRVLPQELVNRIAAGECIERPASVVKELVENALDAGATRIDVTIEDGGRQLIRVADDGCGMDAEDLALSVRPHATSKIARDTDLFDIHTMGFRGEALPSIGSVARLTITSRLRGQDAGHTLTIDGGQLSGPRPIGCPPGTSVEVRDLFYAVPARRKFLKTNQTEVGHVTEQFARLALPHPQVALSLRHAGRVLHSLPASDDPLKRIADLYGPELAQVLLPIERSGQGVEVRGWASPPRETRGTNKWEYVFVNGRFVRDRFVSHAVRSAYRSLIDPSRYPVVFLFIDIAPDQIDVNVHPTKIEVRWRDSNYVHGQVLAALRDKFLRTNLDHTLRAGDTPAVAQQARVRQALVDYFTRPGLGVPDGPRGPDLPAPRWDPSQPDARYDAGRPTGLVNPFAEPVEPSSRPGDERQARADNWPVAPESPTARFDRNAAAPEPLPIEPVDLAGETAGPPRAIQIHNAYLLVETAEGLMIVDQHALHERILFEELRVRIAERALESQRLLLPDMVAVPADRIEVLESHAELLARLGIELTPAGPQTVAVQAFPSLLERADRELFVRDLLDRLAEPGARPEPEALLHELLDMMACKAAVKFGDPLTPDEISALLARKDVALRSSHCPHGRPTTLRMTLRDLERQFHRR